MNTPISQMTLRELYISMAPNFHRAINKLSKK
jgi:hypothetical protein